MKVHADCVPCLMKRVLFQSRLVDNGREMDSVEAALMTYADSFSRDGNSAEIATKVHASSYRALGVEDPYLDLKIAADEVAAKYLDELQEIIESSEDRLATAVRLSIIGNVMDFGSGIAIDDPDDFHAEFRSLLEQGIPHDDTGKMEKVLSEGKTVIYVFDNCGESQFDILLIRELRRMGKRVVGVVRGEPVLNDVTRSDAERIGLDKELDLLLDTGVFAIGIDMKRIGEELRKEIEGADIIIAKGMANYESTSDDKLPIPIVHLMRTKCKPVAESIGVPLEISLVYFRDAGQ